jgi:dCMP deaminase
VYTTLQPCFGCLKELLQASVREVCYLSPWESRFRVQYEALVARLGRANFRLVKVQDPEATWALGRGSTASLAERALGHEPL